MHGSITRLCHFIIYQLTNKGIKINNIEMHNVLQMQCTYTNFFFIQTYCIEKSDGFSQLFLLPL